MDKVLTLEQMKQELLQLQEQILRRQGVAQYLYQKIQEMEKSEKGSKEAGNAGENSKDEKRKV